MECVLCGEDKNKDSFLENRNKCRKCRSIENRDRFRTRDGLVKRIYSSQKTNSKSRGHKPPEYSLAIITKWVLENKDFERLYKNWVDSGYSKEMKPSVDRLDNSKHYYLGNIQLVTWYHNKDKGHNDSKTEKLSTGKKKRPVVQIDSDGKYIASYISINEAHRQTGAYAGDIIGCCKRNGINFTAGGYQWAYLEDIRNTDEVMLFNK